MMRTMRAGVVQFEHSNGDKETNLLTIQKFVDESAMKGVEILAFPECCISGYWFIRNLSHSQLAVLAEPVPEGPSSQRLIKLALQYRMIIGAGLIEYGEDGKFYNTYIVALPDGNIHFHRKINAFESLYITSGSNYTIFDTPFGCRVGILICYDNNIIENARMMALKEVDILMAPHQTGGCLSRSPHAMGLVDPELWERRHEDPAAIEAEFHGPKGREWLMRWLPARAHDNGMFVLFSNGVGRDDNEIRTGNAMILDPYGRIINETWKAQDELVIGDLDASLLENCTGRRWLQARRPELYGALTKPTGKELETRIVRMGEE